jgi:hypothetical protein
MLEKLNRDFLAEKPYKAVELLSTVEEPEVVYHYIGLDIEKVLKVTITRNSRPVIGEPQKFGDLALERINDVLKSLKKRVRAVDYLQWDGGSAIKRYFFRLNNGKHLIVTTDGGYLRSILVQVDKWKKYTYQINGQSGTNTDTMFMDFYCESRIPFNFI